MKKLFLISLLSLGVGMQMTSVSAREAPPSLANLQTQAQATATARARYQQEALQEIQPKNYDLSEYPITDGNENHWRNILWTTAVVEPQVPYVAEALQKILAFTQHSQLSEAQQRTVQQAMQVATQLYLVNPTVYSNLKQPFLETIASSDNSEWVAMALSGLAKGQMDGEQLNELTTLIRRRFPNWSKDVMLATTLENVAEFLSPPPVPPLSDLLNWTIVPGQPQLYVICAKNRQVLCRAVLKGKDGQFSQSAAAGEDSQLWSVPLLLRSIYTLNWNFFRGQTPQGIFRIEGTTQPEANTFRAFGQFPLVNLFLPFETGVDEFFPGHKGSFTGTIKDYQELLPPSWRNYFPIQQAYWAGKIGRSLFRIHGSGESPDFFSSQNRNQDSYNWNPTIGCLSAIELYNEAGVLQQADMPKILSALKVGADTEKLSGYLIVVEIPHPGNSPISLAEIQAALQQISQR